MKQTHVRRPGTAGYIDSMLIRAGRNSAQWEKRHIAAWHRDTAGIPSLIAAWGAIADEHQERFGSKIGNDSVLGAYWVEIAHGIIGLLNGYLGNLDGGACDKLIRRLAAHHDVDLED